MFYERYDFEQIGSQEALLEVDSNKIENSRDYFITDHLARIDTELLEGLAKQLSYDEIFHTQAWKHNFFANVGWRKAL